jgi:hypothetical protein
VRKENREERREKKEVRERERRESEREKRGEREREKRMEEITGELPGINRREEEKGRDPTERRKIDTQRLFYLRILFLSRCSDSFLQATPTLRASLLFPFVSVSLPLTSSSQALCLSFPPSFCSNRISLRCLSIPLRIPGLRNGKLIFSFWKYLLRLPQK